MFYIVVWPLTVAVRKCVHLPYLRHISLKDIWIGASDYYVLLPNCTISFDSYTSINEFYKYIIFSLLINGVILLLNCLVLIVYLYIHFLCLKCHFLYLNII